MRPLPDLLKDAFAASDLSVPELLARTRLDLDRTSLARKLRGQQRMFIDEARVIADALGLRLEWKLRRAA